MKPVDVDINAEIEALPPGIAAELKRVVASVLKLARTSQGLSRSLPFSERIAGHPAIGTWPPGRDIDRHVAGLREEWAR